ncbi:MAG: hypothetical protein ABJN26_12985 [Stappiaceae bacterium]
MSPWEKIFAWVFRNIAPFGLTVIGALLGGHGVKTGDPTLFWIGSLMFIVGALWSLGRLSIFDWL